MKTLRMGIALLVAAMAVGLTACGTGTDATSTSAASAASAVGSHFNADLATGYESLAATRKIGNGLAIAGSINKATAKMIESQCDSLRATLDALNNSGSSTTNNTVLDNTLRAIDALSVYVRASQGAKT